LQHIFNLIIEDVINEMQNKVELFFLKNIIFFILNLMKKNIAYKGYFLT